MNHPDLDYPCPWEYRVIGLEKTLHKAIASALSDRPHSIAASATSQKGTYSSVKVSITVESDADRVRVFQVLKAHSAIKIVL